MNIKPATPLPWKARLGEFDFSNSGERVVMSGSENDESYKRVASVATVAERTRKTSYKAADAARDKNAAYIAHACNAYPKLVEALKEANNALAFVSERIQTPGTRPLVDKQIALLRELGEAE